MLFQAYFSSKIELSKSLYYEIFSNYFHINSQNQKNCQVIKIQTMRHTLESQKYPFSVSKMNFVVLACMWAKSKNRIRVIRAGFC